jgi:hypothetical protein
MYIALSSQLNGQFALSYIIARHYLWPEAVICNFCPIAIEWLSVSCSSGLLFQSKWTVVPNQWNDIMLTPSNNRAVVPRATTHSSKKCIKKGNTSCDLVYKNENLI